MKRISKERLDAQYPPEVVERRKKYILPLVQQFNGVLPAWAGGPEMIEMERRYRRGGAITKSKEQ